MAKFNYTLKKRQKEITEKNKYEAEFLIKIGKSSEYDHTDQQTFTDYKNTADVYII